MRTQAEILQEIYNRGRSGTLPRNQQSQPTIDSAYQGDQQDQPYQGNSVALLYSIANESQKQTAALESIYGVISGANRGGGYNQKDKDNGNKADHWNIIGRTLASATMIGSGVASNNGSMIVGGLLNSLSMIPGPIGKIVTAFALVASGAALLSNALVNRAKEIQQFSGTIAVAVAKSDVRKMMADIREAQALGSDYARLIEKQTDAEIAIRDAIIPIKQFLLETMADVAETVASLINSDEFKAFIAANVSIAKGVGFLARNTTGLGIILNAIKNNTAKKVDADIDLATPLLNMAKIPDANPIPPKFPAQPAVDIPLFNGL